MPRRKLLPSSPCGRPLGLSLGKANFLGKLGLGASWKYEKSLESCSYYSVFLILLRLVL